MTIPDREADLAKYLVTSALPYANGPIHFGHVAGAYLPADIFVRFRRLSGDQVLYICGTDEHGAPITANARAAGMSPSDFTAKWHAVIKSTFQRLSIEFDEFSRTSLPGHRELSQRFFLEIEKNGYLETRQEDQPYCPVDRMFLPDRYLVGTCPRCGYEKARGDECPKCAHWIEKLIEPRCKLCGTAPETRATSHWYLSLQKLQPKLEAWLAPLRDSWKVNVLAEVDKWLKEGLKPRAITRDLEWGVPVPRPDAEGKVLYVWFDAPIGYVSATIEWAARTGQPEAWKDWWHDPEVKLLHFIGKDNIVFHTLTWPAMLMAQDQPFILPANVPANEFFNLEGGKFSTSEGWYLDLDDVFSKYPTDALRYALARNLPETGDSEWRWDDFQAKVNAELNDAYGNLAQRCLKFVDAHFGGAFPAPGPIGERDAAELEALAQWPALVGERLSEFRIRAAAQEFMELARRANRYFNDKTPWKTRTADPEDCKTTMHVTGRILAGLAILGQPFMPGTSRSLWQQLGFAPEAMDAVGWSGAGRLDLPTGQKIGTIAPLFEKIPDEAIRAEVEALEARKAKAARATPKGADPVETDKGAPSPPSLEPFGATVAYDDFAKLDLRVGRIVEAEEVPKSKKLLKLQVDLGLETRQILAGLKESYTPEQMKGRKVAVLANLAPRTMMGLVSQGMILAATDPGDHKARLVAVDESLPPGARIS